jgi:hypothetical protein
VLPARLSPVRVITEQRRIDAQLAGAQGQHGRRWGLRSVERAPWITKHAELVAEAQPIARAALGAHERQALAAQDYGALPVRQGRWGYRIGGCAARPTEGFGATSEASR